MLHPSGSLLSPVSVEYMLELEGGTDDPYGAGIFPMDTPFGTLYGHSGSYVGFESEMWTLRGANVTIAVQLNGDDAAGKVWNKVADAYFGSEYFAAASRHGFPCPTVLIPRDTTAGPTGAASSSSQKPKPDATAATTVPITGSPQLAISSSDGHIRAGVSTAFSALIAAVCAQWLCSVSLY